MLKKENKPGRLQQIGDFGQQLGRDFLAKRGYRIIAQKYYSQFGEIDLIAQQGCQLVFVEVKTRLSVLTGLPEEAVSHSKAEKLLKTAWQYLADKQIADDNFRLDCLAVEIDQANKKAVIRHYKNII